MQQSMLVNPAKPRATPRRVSSVSDPAKRTRIMPQASSASTSTVQRTLFSGAPERRGHVAATAGTDSGLPMPPPVSGTAPTARLGQGNLAVEAWEMDAEVSADSVALAETTLARLLVQLWRARRAGPQAGLAAADSGADSLDFRAPQWPDLAERCVAQNQ